MANKINLDTSQRVDITCRKGDTFTVSFTFKDGDGVPIDTSGYTWKLDVKETDTSTPDIIPDASFTYTGTNQGVLTITAPASTMATVDGGIYVYDLQSDQSGVVKTWLYGVFKVNEDVSE
jgi:hypothetical protein